MIKYDAFCGHGFFEVKFIVFISRIKKNKSFMIKSSCGIYLYHFDPVNSSVTGQSNSQQFQQLKLEFCIFRTNFSNDVCENIILLVKRHKLSKFFRSISKLKNPMIRELLVYWFVLEKVPEQSLLSWIIFLIYGFYRLINSFQLSKFDIIFNMWYNKFYSNKIFILKRYLISKKKINYFEIFLKLKNFEKNLNLKIKEKWTLCQSVSDEIDGTWLTWNHWYLMFDIFHVNPCRLGMWEALIFVMLTSSEETHHRIFISKIFFIKSHPLIINSDFLKKIIASG